MPASLRVAVLFGVLVGAALSVAPAATAHPVKVGCGSQAGFIFYPGAWESQLSTDPNTVASGIITVLLVNCPLPSNAYPMPCIDYPSWDCSSDGNHIPVGDLCPYLTDMEGNPPSYCTNPSRPTPLGVPLGTKVWCAALGPYPPECHVTPA